MPGKAVPRPIALVVPTTPPRTEVKTVGVIPEVNANIEPLSCIVEPFEGIQAASTAMNGPSAVHDLFAPLHLEQLQYILTPPFFTIVFKEKKGGRAF